MGHDFGEVLTDRDRRERGDEVIVTIREFRECERCGETRVISENKEVRHAAPESTSPDEEPEADSGTPASPGGVGAGVGEDVAAEEDDGVILEDEPAERERGAWPETESDEADAGDDEPGEPTPWPEVEGEDEGYDAEPGDGGPAEGVEFSSGLTPEATANDPGSGASAEDAGDVVESAGETGFRSAGPGPSPTGRQRARGADAEFYCPECEHTIPAQDSSHRPGDICPNCRLGYLTERDS